MKPPDSGGLDAVIFDFNGTLFWDAAFHDAAWTAFGDKYGVSLTPDELERHVLGFTNREILMYLFRRRLADREVLRYSREKESLYRNQCLAHPGSCLLAPGAESFLDLLKERNIARTIATASIQENVWFFNRTFDLERWFTFEHIVFDNGTLRGKPFPDMFLAAATALGTPMDHCMVIEDSISGIRGALNAGAGRVVAISPIEAQNKFRDVEGIHQVVSDFSEVDCSGFPPPERA